MPDKVDLAVIVDAGARPCRASCSECADAGVKGAIIISAGFKETGPHGVELERQILAEARRRKMRIIGPNCLGVMNPLDGLERHASPAGWPGRATSRSSARAARCCTAILDWSLKEQVGFSAFVSIGSMLDVGWGDLIDYFGNDPHTQEHPDLHGIDRRRPGVPVGGARGGADQADHRHQGRPHRSGRQGRGVAHRLAHRQRRVLDAAFRRSGVLRVNNIADLFYMAEVLAKQPRPQGPRLTILTNAGGPGVLATDALITAGGELAPLSDETIETLNDFLPPHWSHGNPVDVLGDAEADRYAKALEIVRRRSQQRRAARHPHAAGHDRADRRPPSS